MTRRNFTKFVKVSVIKRATRNGVVYCEDCGLPCRKFQIDHVIADSHGGKPTIENASLICAACYGVKNPKDTTIAAKIKRQESKHLGAKATPAAKIANRGFPKADKAPRIEKTTPAEIGPSAIARRFGIQP